MNRRAVIISAAASIAGVILLIYLLVPAAENAQPHSVSRTEDIAAAPGQQSALEKPARGQLVVAREDEAEQKIRELEVALADAQTTAAEPRKAKAPFADPEMKKVMQSEAAASVERGIAALFEAGLGEELQLTAEQEKAVRDLLKERGSIVWEQIMIPMAAGELDKSRMAAAGQEVREKLARSTAEIRQMLGSQGFAAYERFEKAQPDRDSVKQMRPKFAQAGLELGEEQQAELLRVMAEQRATSSLQDFGDPMKIDYGRFDETFSEENTDRYFREKQLFNERLAHEAQRTLTPEQAALFRNLLAMQLQRARFTVRSTRAMMGQTR
jgi:hypothetical protein